MPDSRTHKDAQGICCQAASRPQLPQRDGEDTLHHRPVQGEERGAGDGDTAVTGDSG